MKDGWKSAISYVYAYDNMNEYGNITDGNVAEDEIVIDISEIIAGSGIRENKDWELVTEAIKKEVNTIESSSMGRLFDAVSSLLGICHENNYEGECAILLEDAAAKAMKNPGQNREDDLALKFHKQVAEAVLARCVKIREKTDIGKVALTGGVFQNRIFMEKTLELLRNEGFDVYYNISVSPNDGGIALGQNYIGMCHFIEKERETV
jgi:hydrogenase maturation protein HypF